jgi:DNA-binding transcriptional ArsR family regulator
MSRAVAHADVFQAIADPTRRRILALLAGGELPVNALAGQFHTSVSAVSQHLRVLRDAGLVRVRQAGRERLYRLDADPLREVAAWAGEYERFWDEKLGALGAHLEAGPEQEAP